MSRCIIEFDKDGIAKVSTPTGNPSRLYTEALRLLEDQEKAIEVVSVAYTDTYKELYPNRIAEPTLEEALATFNYIRAGELAVSTEDLMDISDIMFESEITSIEDLESLLTKTFRPEGITDINEQRLRESGLYSELEVLNFVNGDNDVISLNKTIDLVSRLSQEEFTHSNLELDNFYEVVSTEKDGLGRHRKVSDATVDSMIYEATKGYTSEASFYSKIQELDIPSLVQEFNEDSAFATSVYNRINSLTPVNVVEVVEGKLVNKPINSTVSTINSTIMLGEDSREFRNLVETLSEIDTDILESEPQLLEENLDRLEKLAANLNVDIVGLKNLSVEEAFKLLTATTILVDKASQKRVTTEDVNAFSEIRDNILDSNKGNEQSLESVDPVYSKLNTLKLYSELSEEKLLTNYGLIRIGDNLYHRVSTEDSLETLYEELYRKYLNNSDFMPTGYISVRDKLNPGSKPTILEGIKSFINTRQTGLDIEAVGVKEKASIYQVLFNHKTLVEETESTFEALAGAESSPQYLTQQFVADFYNTYLAEKQADSKLYKDVLSKFVFNNKDITVKGIDNRFLNTLNNLKTDIPAYSQIREYASLKKNDPINSLAVINKPIGILPNIDRIQIANNPQVLPTYQGNVTRINNYIHTKAKDSFIKVKNNIYQRVGNNVYAKLVSRKSTNYYTVPLLSYNRTEVQAIENAHNTPSETPAITFQEFTETVNNKSVSSSTLNVVKALNANTDTQVRSAFRITNGSSHLSFAQNGNKVELAMVKTPKADRGQGQAKQLVSEFTAALDQSGVKSILYADPRDADTTAEQLVSFYEQFGYRPSPAYDAEVGFYEMERSPKKVKLQETVEVKETLTTPSEVFEALTNKMRGSGLSNIYTGKEQVTARFNELKKLGKIKESINIEDINGFNDSNSVYIVNNNVNTLVHEQGHVWYAWAKANRNDIIEKGHDLIKGTPYYTAVEQSSIYQDMTEEQKLEEALIQAIGDKGEQIVDEQKQADFKGWLTSLWASVKNFFGITDMTPEEIQNLTLGQFTRAVASDIIEGKSFNANSQENRADFIGDNTVVEGSDIQEVKTGQPIVAKVYHGTTNDFYVFDSSVKGTVEGHLGRVNYFTSEYYDAQGNYLSTGADIMLRVDQRADEIQGEIESDQMFDEEGELAYEEIANFYNIPIEEIEEKGLAEVAGTVAEAELIGDSEQVLELLVKANNPVVIGSNWRFADVYDNTDHQEYLEDATEEIAEEYDITIEEAKEDYQYEIDTRAAEMAGLEEHPYAEALRNAITENTGAWGDPYAKTSEILGEFYDREIDLNALESTLRDLLSFEESPEGKLIGNQIISDFFENLGYDAIILTDVSQRFKGMGLGEGTSHIHVFDNYNNQIKLDDGRNETFNERTSDIRFQETSTTASTEQLTESKVKEVFTTLQNPINIVTLSNEIEINECRG